MKQLVLKSSFLLLTIGTTTWNLHGQSISSIPATLGGGGVGAANVTATSVAAVTSLALNVSSLALTTVDTLIVQCYTGTSAPYTPVVITTINPASTTSITANFVLTANVTCRANSSGGAGVAGAAGAAGATGATGATGAAGTNGTNGAISQIQDEGTGLTVRGALNFVGAGVTCVDDSGNARTVCTITSGSGSITGCGANMTLNGTVCDVNTATIGTKAADQTGAVLYCAGTGSASAQTCTMAPTLATYTTGQIIHFVPGTTNVTTQSLAVDGLTALNILAQDGTALTAGLLTAGRQYDLAYNGTTLRLGPAGSSGSTLSFSPVLSFPPGGTYAQTTCYASAGCGYATFTGGAVTIAHTYSATATNSSLTRWFLPTNFNSTANMTVIITWYSDTYTTGDVKWAARGACSSAGGAIEPAQSATQATATATIQGTVNTMSFTTLTLASTNLTSCSGGKTIDIEIQRLGADAADTMAGLAFIPNLIIQYGVN